MKKAVSLYQKWRQKQNFVHLALSMDQRLMSDIGFTHDVVQEKLRTPFWKY